MAEVNGQWYVFYHRQTNRSRYARQCCAEPVQILPDGSIPQVEVTSCGLKAGPLPASGRYEARIACNLSAAEGVYGYPSQMAKDAPIREDHPYFTQSGGDREGDGDQHIANLQDGALAGFKYFAFTGEEKTISVTVRGSASGTLCVTIERGGTTAAEIPVTSSTDWTKFSAPLAVKPGKAPLYFTYHGDGALDLAAFTIE